MDVTDKEALGIYAWALGEMIGGGVPILDALKNMQGFTEPRLGELTRQAHDSIREGGSMTERWEQEPLKGRIDRSFIDLVDIAEETGDLDNMLLLFAEDALVDSKLTLAEALNRPPAVQRFTDLLAQLQRAGLPLLRSVQVVKTRPGWGDAEPELEKLAERIENGRGLIEPLRGCKAPLAFDPIYLSIVAAGENEEELDEALLRLARQSRRITSRVAF